MKLVCAAVVAALQAVLPAPPPHVPFRPNVLILVADDISAQDLEAVHTPFIDRIAERGTTFRRAYSMPTCSPTRFGIVFGRYRTYDSGNVCGEVEERTPALLSSLPGTLGSNGYGTALFGKWHVGTNPAGPWEEAPRRHGFDAWRAGTPMNLGNCGSESYWDWTRVDDGFVSRCEEYNTQAIVCEFEEWWRAGATPKFAMVGFCAAHRPVHLPPEDMLPPGWPRSPATSRESFEAMVRSIDVAVGRMLESVDLDDTVVVFLADNGTDPLCVSDEIPGGRAKGTVYEGGIRIPFLVSAPGFPRRQQTDSLVHVVDLMATLVELTGCDPSVGDLDSISFVPVLRDSASTPRTYVYSGLEQGGGMSEEAIVTARYKLIRQRVPLAGRQAPGQRKLDVGRAIWNRAAVHESLQERLFDLAMDPLEAGPLDPDDPEFVELSRSLRALFP